jgi:hypothetical protein
MKDGIGQIVGKTISDVVVMEGPGSSRQVFVIFTDDTNFELWGNSFTGSGGVDPGGLERVKAHLRDGSKIAMEFSQPASAIEHHTAKASQTNNFPRYCVLLVFFSAFVGTVASFLEFVDTRSAGDLVLAGVLAGVCYYIFRYQIHRWNYFDNLL